MVPCRRRFLALVFSAFVALFAWSPRALADGNAPVVVVGEGPVGLITAIRVKMEQPSIPVTIYEKRAEDRPGRPQTPLLDQRTVDILHDAGFPVGELIPIKSKVMVQPDGTTKTTTMPPMIRLSAKGATPLPGDSVAAIQTGELEAQLRKRAVALGIDIKYNTEVRHAANKDGAVSLEVGTATARGATPAAGHRETARFVVFADGPSGYGAVVAKRETVGTMPMAGAISPRPADGKNLVVRTTDPHSGEVVSISRLASGQVIAQLPRQMTNATPAEKDAYLVNKLPLLGMKKEDLGQRLVFSGELANGTTGNGHILVAGDATGAVPIVTSANLGIHIPLATKMATTIAKLYSASPSTAASTLNTSHKEWTQELHATREAVTAPVRSRLTDVSPAAKAPAAAPPPPKPVVAPVMHLAH